MSDVPLTVQDLILEAALWDGAKTAHLDQARSSMTRLAELELQIREALAKADRLLASARRDLEAGQRELAALRSPSHPANGGLP